MSSSLHTNQTQDQTTHQVVTPTNPQFTTDALSNVTGLVNGLAGADPQSLIAGPDALQTQAGAGAAGLTGTPGTYAGANDLATSIGQMSAPDIASLMAPFKGAFDNRVINPTLAAFDQNSTLTNAQNDLNRGQDVTFGGSGASITDALTRGQQALARGQVQGGLLSDQFKTALGGATSQAGVNQTQQGLRLNAADQLVNSANDEGATNRADIATQGGIGSILQGLTQAKTGAPVSLASSLASILGAEPLGLLRGQNEDGASHGTTDSTTTSSDPLKTLGSLAMLAAAPFTGGASLAGGLGRLFGGAGAAGAAGLGGFGASNAFASAALGL